MLCDHCGYDERIAKERGSTHCAPPFLVQPHSFTGNHPADLKKANEMDDELKEPNPWHPITDSVDLKHLGKLAEEAGELCSAASRCMIQGMLEAHPITGKANFEWLEDEIADIEANIALVKDRFSLDRSRINVRREAKFIQLRKWHDMA